MSPVCRILEHMIELITEAGAEDGAGPPTLRPDCLSLPPGVELGVCLGLIDLDTLDEGDLLDVLCAMERQAAYDAGRRNAALAALHALPISVDGLDSAALAKSGQDLADRIIRGSRADAYGARTALSPNAAAGKIALAVDLSPEGRLAATGDLLRAGRISEPIARLVGSRLRFVEDNVAQAVQGALLPLLPGMSWGRVDYRLAREVLTRLPERSEKAHEAARQLRRVGKPIPQPAGMALMELSGPADDLAAVWAAIDALGAESASAERAALRAIATADSDLVVKPNADAKSDSDALTNCGAELNDNASASNDPCTSTAPSPGGDTGASTAPGLGGDTGAAAQSLDAHRFDTLVALVCQPLGDDRLPRQQGRRPGVQVTVAASTLLGLDDSPGDLEGYGPVPAAVARRIAADPSGTWRRILTDPVGRCLELNTTRYRPTQALADSVIARDRQCVFPGCEKPARQSDVDHRLPYPRGRTDLANLQALCRRHHQQKTVGLWSAAVDRQTGDTQWTDRHARSSMRRVETYPTCSTDSLVGEPLELPIKSQVPTMLSGPATDDDAPPF